MCLSARNWKPREGAFVRPLLVWLSKPGYWQKVATTVPVPG